MINKNVINKIAKSIIVFSALGFGSSFGGLSWLTKTASAVTTALYCQTEPTSIARLKGQHEAIAELIKAKEVEQTLMLKEPWHECKNIDYNGEKFWTSTRLPEEDLIEPGDVSKNQDDNYLLVDYVHVLEGQHPEWEQHKSQDLNQSIVQKTCKFVSNAYAKCSLLVQNTQKLAGKADKRLSAAQEKMNDDPMLQEYLVPIIERARQGLDTFQNPQPCLQTINTLWQALHIAIVGDDTEESKNSLELPKRTLKTRNTTKSAFKRSRNKFRNFK